MPCFWFVHKSHACKCFVCALNLFYRWISGEHGTKITCRRINKRKSSAFDIASASYGMKHVILMSQWITIYYVSMNLNSMCVLCMVCMKYAIASVHPFNFWWSEICVIHTRELPTMSDWVKSGREGGGVKEIINSIEWWKIHSSCLCVDDVLFIFSGSD